VVKDSPIVGRLAISTACLFKESAPASTVWPRFGQHRTMSAVDHPRYLRDEAVFEEHHRGRPATAPAGNSEAWPGRARAPADALLAQRAKPDALLHENALSTLQCRLSQERRSCAAQEPIEGTLVQLPPVTAAACVRGTAEPADGTVQIRLPPRLGRCAAARSAHMLGLSEQTRVFLRPDEQRLPAGRSRLGSWRRTRGSAAHHNPRERVVAWSACSMPTCTCPARRPRCGRLPR
jgi:hypothetical protein